MVEMVVAQKEADRTACPTFFFFFFFFFFVPMRDRFPLAYQRDTSNEDQEREESGRHPEQDIRLFDFEADVLRGDQMVVDVLLAQRNSAHARGVVLVVTSEQGPADGISAVEALLRRRTGVIASVDRAFDVVRAQRRIFRVEAYVRYIQPRAEGARRVNRLVIQPASDAEHANHTGDCEYSNTQHTGQAATNVTTHIGQSHSLRHGSRLESNCTARIKRT